MTSPKRFQASDVTVAIPTYGRGQVLIDTVRACLNEPHPPALVVVVDQTPDPDADTVKILSQWQAEGKVIWDRPPKPSQPAAMNRALSLVKTPLVLFLDDDIEPAPGFIQAHAESFDEESIWITVGQIIQPWQTPSDIAPTPGPDGLREDFDFPFHTTRQVNDIHNCMSGHMAVRLNRALEFGGFDENYHGAAYRFDTDFGRRAIQAGGRIKFIPNASIKHLRVPRGGTRIQGDHLASSSPKHGQGDYYFAMRHGTTSEAFVYCLRRFFREVRTKFHLTHPWYIPVKLLGEARAILWAWQLSRSGPALIKRPESTSGERHTS